MNGVTILFVYAVIMILATVILTKKEKNVERFCVGSRSENWLMSALSIAATWIWAPALFVSTEKAYSTGWVGLFWFLVPNALCLVIFIPFAKKIRKEMPEGMTLSGYMKEKYKSDGVKRVYLFQLIGLSVLSTGVQLLAGSQILSAVTGISFKAMTILLACIAISYSLFSGIKASMLTDAIQMVFMLVACSLFVIFGVRNTGTQGIIQGLSGISGDCTTLFSRKGVEIFLAFGLPTTIGLLSGPFGDQSFWQRAFAVKKEKLGRAFLLGTVLFAVVPLSMGILAYLEVNGSVDENGEFQVQYIKDIDNEFSRTKYDTWCLYLTQYVYRKFDSNGEDTVISDTRHSAEWLPEGGAIRPDGTIRPFVAIAKYMSGDNADGVASSISGVSPKNYSFQSSLTKFRAKGTQYCAETSQDSERMTRLMEIAFATRNSQSVMAGCNWWWTQTPATVQENDVERIIISKSAAKELVVGGTVSIGNASSLTNDSKPETDRGNTGLNAKANRVRITKIEDYDDNSSAVYVDNGGQKFSTASTTVSGVTCPTMLSTMPWNTGGCDDVLGSCGSPTSNASGKEPYILFGVEMSSGFWEPKGNTVMKIENHVMRPYICYDCTKITTAGATTEDWIALGYVIPDNKGSWKYISKLGYSADDPEVRYPVEVNASSSNGYADGCYTEDLEKAGDGQREVLGSGILYHGAVDGRRGANLDPGLGDYWWTFAARLSACGRCGRRAAA